MKTVTIKATVSNADAEAFALLEKLSGGKRALFDLAFRLTRNHEAGKIRGSGFDTPAEAHAAAALCDVLSPEYPSRAIYLKGTAFSDQGKFGVTCLTKYGKSAPRKAA